jgi:hypothetical protein
MTISCTLALIKLIAAAFTTPKSAGKLPNHEPENIAVAEVDTLPPVVEPLPDTDTSFGVPVVVDRPLELMMVISVPVAS